MNRITSCLRPVGLTIERQVFKNTFQTKLHTHTAQFSRNFHQARSLFTEEKKEEPKVEDTPEAREANYKKIIEEKDAAIKEANDRLLRTLADMENLRMRTRRDVDDARKYSAGEMAKGVLVISDNLALALNSVKEDVADKSNKILCRFYDGVVMTEKEMFKTFEKYGITRMNCVGEKFDAKFHECLFEYPDEKARPGSVGQILKDGFMIKDRLLRAPQVGIIKGSWVPTEAELKAAAEKK